MSGSSHSNCSLLSQVALNVFMLSSCLAASRPATWLGIDFGQAVTTDGFGRVVHVLSSFRILSTAYRSTKGPKRKPSFAGFHVSELLAGSTGVPANGPCLVGRRAHHLAEGCFVQ